MQLPSPTLLAAVCSTCGLASWLDFARSSRLHLDTPLTNHLRLEAVLSYDHDQRTECALDAPLADPLKRWKEARRGRCRTRQNWRRSASKDIFGI